MATQKGLTIVSTKDLAKLNKALASSAKTTQQAIATIGSLLGEQAKKPKAKKATATADAKMQQHALPESVPVTTAQAKAPKAAAAKAPTKAPVAQAKAPKAAAAKAPTKAPVARAKANGSFNPPKVPGVAHA